MVLVELGPTVDILAASAKNPQVSPRGKNYFLFCPNGEIIVRMFWDKSVNTFLTEK